MEKKWRIDKMSEPVSTTIIYKVFFTSIMAYIAYVLTYVNLNAEVYSIFAILMIIDILTGLMKSIILERKITPGRLTNGLISKMSILILPIVLAMGAKAVGEDATRFVVWGMNLLILSEVYSVMGNVYTIRTKEFLPEWDAIALIAKGIREFVHRKKD